MMKLSAALILSPALVSPAFAKSAPEWTQIKSAETAMKTGQFPDAESDLQQALSINPDEPKIDEDLALVHIVFDELSQAKKDVQQAIDISKRKQARFKKGGTSYKAWQKYLAELCSINTEITILQNESVLRPGLMKSKGKKPKPAALDKALSRVRAAYEQVKTYGSFKSRIDDELIAKAITALSSHNASKAAAAKAPEAAPAEEADDAASEDDGGGEEAKQPAAGGGADEEDNGGDDGGQDMAGPSQGAGGAKPAAQVQGNAAIPQVDGGAPAGGSAPAGVAPAAAAPGASGPAATAAPTAAAGQKAKSDDAAPFAAMAPAPPSAGAAGTPPAAANKPAAADKPAAGGGANPFGDAPTK
jgi:hypothetical protein